MSDSYRLVAPLFWDNVIEASLADDVLPDFRVATTTAESAEGGFIRLAGLTFQVFLIPVRWTDDERQEEVEDDETAPLFDVLNLISDGMGESAVNSIKAKNGKEYVVLLVPL